MRRLVFVFLWPGSLTLVGCPTASAPQPSPAVAPPSGAPSAAPSVALPHPWPPREGEAFPDLRFLDDTGASVSLASLRGKVLLVEPVGLSCPGCQAFSGGGRQGGFRGVTPQAGLPELDDILRQAGVNPAHRDLVLIQVLFFGMQLETPGVADAAAWVEHFDLRLRPNTFVLLGDDRYRAHPATLAMVPGFFVVGRDGVLLADASRTATPETQRTWLTRLRAALEPAQVDAPEPAPGPGQAPAPAAPVRGAASQATGDLPDPSSFPEAAERAEEDAGRALLAERRWAELDASLLAARRAGRLPGRYTTRAEALCEALGQGPGGAEERLARLEAWVQGAPRSAWARAARGVFYRDWAWEARGGGYANTVSEEGWRLFAERLRLAAADLEAALRLDPGCEPALAVRMTVAYGQSVSAETAARWFEQAAAVTPPLVNAYVRYLSYLMPKWHGDEEGRQMWAFARASLQAHPEEPALRCLVGYAWEEVARAGGEANLRRNAAEVRAAWKAVTDAYPRGSASWVAWARAARILGDEAAARSARERAAEAGDPDELSRLAQSLESGKDGFAMDIARARRLHWRAAHAGAAFSAAKVGYWYERGRGLPQDPIQAAVWYRRAAEGGDSWGQEQLAQCYETGSGVERDPAQALAWYRRVAEGRGDAARRREAAEKVRALERAAAPPRSAATRTHPGGFQDWYPEDVSPPPGTQYPCALTALPRALPGIPPAEREFVNHFASLLLEATHARLRMWTGLDQPDALERYAAEARAVHAKLAGEKAPAGLEPCQADVLAALEGQVVFHQRLIEGLRAERTRIEALGPAEGERRLRAVLEQLVTRIPEGRQASGRLQAAWAKLEARYGRSWDPAVKDSLYHHLCALDVF